MVKLLAAYGESQLFRSNLTSRPAPIGDHVSNVAALRYGTRCPALPFLCRADAPRRPDGPGPDPGPGAASGPSPSPGWQAQGPCYRACRATGPARGCLASMRGSRPGQVSPAAHAPSAPVRSHVRHHRELRRNIRSQRKKRYPTRYQIFRVSQKFRAIPRPAAPRCAQVPHGAAAAAPGNSLCRDRFRRCLIALAGMTPAGVAERPGSSRRRPGHPTATSGMPDTRT
jgi:hypothetical protein